MNNKRTQKWGMSLLMLPIIDEKQTIMKAIDENNVVIIIGEKSIVKTTQLPQFLYEAGYASRNKMIGVIEPKRMAEISVFQRRIIELSETSDIVSQLIRFKGNARSNTKIKFMSDHVMNNEIQNDMLLDKYSVIILYEAHERYLYADKLIRNLSHVVLLRKDRCCPLKLIIMSATLDVYDFSKTQKLFPQRQQIISLGSKQFPVKVHFNKVTPHDYLDDAFNKIEQIHSKLPNGGILVFLPRKSEVKQLVSKLREAFPYQESSPQFLSKTKDNIYNIKNESTKPVPDINSDLYDIEMYSKNDLISQHLTDDDDLPRNITRLITNLPLWVLPLYSKLSFHKQKKVIKPPPPTCRMCVVTTNFAELSLIIPNIKYVVDCGKTKIREYDSLTNVSKMSVVWESKASASQRARKAGRTSPGHCYRLFSSAIFDDEFPRWNLPEITPSPIHQFFLKMNSMKINNINITKFSPNKHTISDAEKKLVLLDALEVDSNAIEITNLILLRKIMEDFMFSLHYAKMIYSCKDRTLLHYMLVIISAMSIKDNVPSKSVKTWIKSRSSLVEERQFLLFGDLMATLQSMGEVYHAMTMSGFQGMQEYCEITGLNKKSILEAWELYNLLIGSLNLYMPSLRLCYDLDMLPPTPSQVIQMRQIVLTGLLDKVAKRLTVTELNKHGISTNKAAYYTYDLREIAYIHNSSVLKKSKPEWLVYQDTFEEHNKIFIKGITAIEPEWLHVYANKLCKTINVLNDPKPWYNEENDKMYSTVDAIYGQSRLLIPPTEIEFPNIIQKYWWFAVFILNGQVFPNLQHFKQHLIFEPELILKNEFDQQFYLLSTILNKNGDDSAKKIKEKWLKNSTYLLDEYLTWLPHTTHNEVKEIWPPL